MEFTVEDLELAEGVCGAGQKPTYRQLLDERCLYTQPPRIRWCFL